MQWVLWYVLDLISLRIWKRYYSGILHTLSHTRITPWYPEDFYFKIMNLGIFSVSFVFWLFHRKSFFQAFLYNCYNYKYFLFVHLFFINKISLFVQSQVSMSFGTPQPPMLWNKTFCIACYIRLRPVLQLWSIIRWTSRT